jgi:hypothetical protein
MSVARRTAVALTLLLLTAHLAAQPPERERGRGMFGRRGMLSDQMRLVSMPEVREELAIDEEQALFLDALVADLRDQQRTAFSRGLDGPERRDPESQFEEFRERLQELHRQSEQLLLAVLEPEQVSRLNELRVQYEGIRAFAREDFNAALELTDNQQDQVRKILATTASVRGRRRGDSAESVAKIKSVLTEGQLAKWEEMKGDEFTFPERSRRFGRRGFPDRP